MCNLPVISVQTKVAYYNSLLHALYITQQFNSLPGDRHNFEIYGIYIFAQQTFSVKSEVFLLLYLVAYLSLKKYN